MRVTQAFLDADTDERLKTKIYDKREDFKCLFLSRNIHSAPFKASHDARVCSQLTHFVDLNVLLTSKCLPQSGNEERRRSSGQIFYKYKHKFDILY